MDATQFRMARAALSWSLDDLAAKSGVGRRTVARFAVGGSANPETVRKLREAFEAGGVVFIERGRFAGGVAPPS